MSTRISKSAAFFLTFIVPVSGLYISARDFRQPYAKNIFWFFCCFMGLIFIFNPEGGSQSDSVRYAEQLQKYREISSFEDIYDSFYNSSSHSADVYNSVITFLVSRVSQNPHILFFVYALIFGFFYSRNLWLILERIKQPLALSFIIVFFYWALVCPIWNINGVRMWTALHVFSYGVLFFIIKGDQRYLLYCAFSILIHFSYMLPCAIMLCFLFLPKNRISLDVLFVVYLLTMFVNELDLAQVRNALSSLNLDFLQNKIDGYTNKDYADRINKSVSEMSLYVGFFKNIRGWGVALLVIVCWRRIRYLSKKEVVYKLFLAGLLFSSVANIAASVPSGGRFIYLGLMILSSALLLFLNMNDDTKLHKRLFQISLLFIFPIMLEVRIGMMFYGVGMLTQNFITAFMWEDIIPFMR